MPKILISYAVNKYIPEEGSEEWLALLPNWSGWYYALGVDHGPYAFNVNKAVVGTSVMFQWPYDKGGKDYTYSAGGIETLPTIGERPYITGTDDDGVLWYYFRGALAADYSSVTRYYVGRATALTPQI